MKVTNMTSNKGNTVANQFIITGIDADYKLDSQYWDFSATTGKYRNQFLGEGIAETRKKIASGEYILTDLNEA